MTVLFSMGERNVPINNPLDGISPTPVNQSLPDGALQFRVVLAPVEVGSNKTFNFNLYLEDASMAAGGLNLAGWRHLAGYNPHQCLPLGTGAGQWQAEDGTANPSLSYSVGPLRGKRVRAIVQPVSGTVRLSGTITHFGADEL